MNRYALLAAAFAFPLFAGPSFAAKRVSSGPEAMPEKELLSWIRSSMGRKQFPEAIQGAKVLERRFPASVTLPKVRSEIFVRIGRTYRKRYGEAAGLYEAYREAFPGSSFAGAAEYKAAFCWERAKRWGDADRAYQRVLERDDGGRFRPGAMLRLAEVCRARGDFTGMSAFAERVATEFPDSPDAVTALFVVADSERLENPARAAVLYGRVLSGRKHLPAGLVERASISLGDTYVARKMYPEAAEAFRQISQETGSREAGFKRARCLEISGLSEEARSAYFDLLRKEPWSGRARDRILGRVPAVVRAARVSSLPPLAGGEWRPEAYPGACMLPALQNHQDAARRPDEPGEAQVLAGPDSIRIAWRFDARARHPEPAKRRKPAEISEALEIHLDPGDTCSAFFRIVVGPEGLLSAERQLALSAGKLPRKTVTVAWPASSRCAAAVKNLPDGGFQGELDVPWEVLGGLAPSAGDAWGFNLIRTRKGPGPDRMSLFPSYPRTLDPVYLGTLTFEPNPPFGG
ncbi:MAG: tetratricopeptide repeat protein [Planctomycetota bacterium]